MKYVFLVNSFSLKKKTDAFIDKLKKVCKKNKLDYIIECNSDSLSTEDIINKYKKSNNIIVSIGGDGTLNRCLNAIIGTKNILGLIPMGTGNDFYKSNKELFKDGINDIDLIKINNKYFINTACFGVDADIANADEVIHSSIIPKSQRYNASIVKNLLKYKPRHLKLKIDGKTYEDDYNTVVLCNGRYYGGGYKIGTNALLDDGLIDVYLARKTSKVKLIKLLLSIKKGKHEKDQSITKVNSKKIIIKSEKKFKCNIDGEVIESNKFDIQMIPKGVKIWLDSNFIKELFKKEK